MALRPKSTCGCPIIDNLNINGKLINIANNTAGMSWCLECPYDFCLQRNAKSEQYVPVRDKEIREVTAYCQNCYEMETIYFIGGHLRETKRFKQIENNIYHIHSFDMSLKPCKLY